MKTTTTFLGLLLLAASLLALPMQAQTIRYVKAGATGDGSSWAAASGDLQAIINASNTNDQVWVAQGTYKPGGSANMDRTISFVMKDGVAIYGGFVGTEQNLSQRPAINPVSGPGGASQPSSSTLSGDIGTLGNTGDNSYHVINNSGLDATARLDGFVITGGNANGTGNQENGGGMFNVSSNLTLANCLFQANSATVLGGGIYNESGNPSLTNCAFQNNNGGAIANNINSSPTLTNCSFQANMGSSGGGIANYNNSSPTLTNCSFVGNSAIGGGGGMYNTTSSNPSLTNCTFRNNSVPGGSGGVMGNYGNSSPVLVNCVLFDNGGSNTFDNNGGSVSIRYSLLEASTTGYTDGGNNLTTTTSPFASPSSTQLSPCSAAINAGSNAAYTSAGGPSTDLAGNPRFYNGGQVDMGAYEFQGMPLPQTGITRQPATGSAVCAGSTVTASVSVSGTVSGYQWYKDGGVVAGQTSATLTLGNVQPGNAGSYSVVVTGTCNSVTSTAFSLTVTPLPTLSISPSNTTVCAGSTLTATPGLAAYRWNTGQTTASIAVTATGMYSVMATSSGGCSASATAQLTVTARPDAPYPTSTPRQLYTTNFPIPLLLYALPTSFALTPRFYNGATNAEINPAVVQPNKAGVFAYYATQTDSKGCVSLPTPFSLTVLSGGTLASKPTDRTVCQGATTVLSVTATGSNLHYTWYESSPDNPFAVSEAGSNTKGGSTATLTVSKVQRSTLYYCLVTGQYSLDVAGPIRVTVNANCHARLGIDEAVAPLLVRVLGNPVRGTELSVEVSGAEGQPLHFQLIDIQGRVVTDRLVDVAGPVEQQRLALGHGASSLLLLQVSTPSQRQTVKVIREN